MWLHTGTQYQSLGSLLKSWLAAVLMFAHVLARSPQENESARARRVSTDQAKSLALLLIK